jgi:hypothetical protein
MNQISPNVITKLIRDHVLRNIDVLFEDEHTLRRRSFYPMEPSKSWGHEDGTPPNCNDSNIAHYNTDFSVCQLKERGPPAGNICPRRRALTPGATPVGVAPVGGRLHRLRLELV